MLLPPWRTARTQLHEKAGQVLGMLADGFAALSEAGESKPLHAGLGNALEESGQMTTKGYALPGYSTSSS